MKLWSSGNLAVPVRQSLENSRRFLFSHHLINLAHIILKIRRRGIRVASLSFSLSFLFLFEFVPLSSSLGPAISVRRSSILLRSLKNSHWLSFAGSFAPSLFARARDIISVFNTGTSSLDRLYVNHCLVPTDSQHSHFLLPSHRPSRELHFASVAHAFFVESP